MGSFTPHSTRAGALIGSVGSYRADSRPKTLLEK